MAKFTPEQLRQKYDEFAKWYDLLEGVPSALLGINRQRRRLLQRAGGRVLEVGAGTGSSFGCYPAGVQLAAIDLSPEMLRRARRRAEKLRRRATLLEMDAQRLAFRDGSFDTVVSTFGLCTYPEPVQALQEFARACRPGGRLLLLEHGKSHTGWMARFQERRAEKHAESLGCHWLREPDRLVRQAGLRIIEHQRSVLGMVHLMEIAVPPEP